MSSRQRRAALKGRRHQPVLGSSAARTSRGGFVLADRVERLAYTRAQAAEALGVSLATLDRRVLPTITTVRTEWGGRLIPVAELERYLAERREEARAQVRRGSRGGRRPAVPPEVVARIHRDHAAGTSFSEIARRLNTDHVQTAQGGRRWWASTVRVIVIRSRPL